MRTITASVGSGFQRPHSLDKWRSYPEGPMKKVKSESEMKSCS